VATKWSTDPRARTSQKPAASGAAFLSEVCCKNHHQSYKIWIAVFKWIKVTKHLGEIIISTWFTTRRLCLTVWLYCWSVVSSLELCQLELAARGWRLSAWHSQCKTVVTCKIKHMQNVQNCFRADFPQLHHGCKNVACYPPIFNMSSTS